MEKFNDRNTGVRRPAKPNVIQGGYRAAFNDSDEEIAEFAKSDDDISHDKHDNHDKTLRDGEHKDNVTQTHGVINTSRKKKHSQSRGCLLLVLMFAGIIAVVVLVTMNLPHFNLENVGPFKFNTDGGFKIAWPFGSGGNPGSLSTSETIEPDGSTEQSDATESDDATEPGDITDGLNTTVSTSDSEPPLMFDDRTNMDYGNMLEAHSTFADAVDAFTTGDIDESEMLKICEDTSTYFYDMANTLTYGADDAQNEYLLAFKAAAMSDQIAADAVKRYITEDTLSELMNEESDYLRNKGDAEKAYAAITSRRETYLENAGVPTPETDVRIGG